VQWFVPSFTLREGLMGVARELSLEDLVRVAPLPSERDYPPGVKADRRPGRSNLRTGHADTTNRVKLPEQGSDSRVPDRP
jgi:hypothetical protein